MLYDYLNHINEVVKSYNPRSNVLAHFVSLNGELMSHFTKYGFYNKRENENFVNKIKTLKVGGGGPEVDDGGVDSGAIAANIDKIADMLKQPDVGSAGASGTCYGAPTDDDETVGNKINDIMNKLDAMNNMLQSSHSYFLSLVVEKINDFLAYADSFRVDRSSRVATSREVARNGMRTQITNVVSHIRSVLAAYTELHDKNTNIIGEGVFYAMNITSILDSLKETTQHIPTASDTKTQQIVDLLLGYITTLHSLVKDKNLTNLLEQLSVMKHLLDKHVPTM